MGPNMFASLYKILEMARTLLKEETQSEEEEVEERQESNKLTKLKSLTNPLQLLQVTKTPS